MVRCDEAVRTGLRVGVTKASGAKSEPKMLMMLFGEMELIVGKRLPTTTPPDAISGDGGPSSSGFTTRVTGMTTGADCKTRAGFAAACVAIAGDYIE